MFFSEFEPCLDREVYSCPTEFLLLQDFLKIGETSQMLRSVVIVMLSGSRYVQCYKQGLP